MDGGRCSKLEHLEVIPSKESSDIERWKIEEGITNRLQISDER